jgi:hypothetical protein
MPMVQQLELSHERSRVKLGSLIKSSKSKLSMVSEKRRREAKEIDQENYKMMVRIINKTPSVSVKKLQQEYQKHLTIKRIHAQHCPDYYPID